MSNDNSLETSKTTVYPFCYKIKENCPPCLNESTDGVNNSTDCVKELSNLSRMSQPNIDKKIKDKNTDELFECLKKYGDIYKQLGIELYVNPKTNQIIFPDNNRIQASLNLFIRENNFVTSSQKELNDLQIKLNLFNILLNDSLRKKYNEFYYAHGFSELDSIKPKEYGIARIMGKEKSKGGKSKKNKTKKNKKTKRKQIKKNRTKQIKK